MTAASWQEGDRCPKHEGPSPRPSPLQQGRLELQPTPPLRQSVPVHTSVPSARAQGPRGSSAGLQGGCLLHTLGTQGRAYWVVGQRLWEPMPALLEGKEGKAGTGAAGGLQPSQDT